MPADNPRKESDWREVFDFVVEGNNFGVVGTGSVAVSFHLLRPRDQHSEVGRLSELRELRSLRRGQNLYLKTHRLKMLRGHLAGLWVDGPDEFCIDTKLFQHARVFATDGA